MCHFPFRSSSYTYFFRFVSFRSGLSRALLRSVLCPSVPSCTIPCRYRSVLTPSVPFLFRSGFIRAIFRSVRDPSVPLSVSFCALFRSVLVPFVIDPFRPAPFHAVYHSV